MTYSEETQEYDRCDQCGGKPALVILDGMTLCRDCEAKQVSNGIGDFQDLHGTRL